MIGVHGPARPRGAVGAFGSVLALVLALAGCGGAIVTNDSLEEQVKSRLGADTVNCPADLKREVGQSTVCTATRGGDTFDVKVTVTGADRDPPDLAVDRVGDPASATATSAALSTADSVEEQVRSRLGTDGAQCPTDLAGEVGRSMICTATRGDDTFDVRVTVTAVRGTAIDLLIERVGGTSAPTAGGGAASGAGGAGAGGGGGVDVVSADPSASIAGDQVARSVRTQLTAGGKQVERVTCPDLPARVGASERCTLVSGAATYGVTVTVTSVQGTDARFDIQVDETPR